MDPIRLTQEEYEAAKRKVWDMASDAKRQKEMEELRERSPHMNRFKRRGMLAAQRKANKRRRK